MSVPAMPSPAATPVQVDDGPLTPFQQHQHYVNAEQQAQSVIRHELEMDLFKLSQLLWEMEICAGDVQPGREGAVAEYIEQVVECYANVLRLSRGLTDDVPLIVLEHLDAVKNPHLYTRKQLEALVTSTQEMHGRFDGLAKYRSSLANAISEAFPDIPIPPAPIPYSSSTSHDPL